ncbi:unnamed protein product [Enterobius vermicularis]|uniref:BPI2 domain-containing protein n=1 Tax=Enterobius vermicularis TaxID=51028 RepID=A0A0N4V234_ENTVE|nr:unnamed protein product [Enterobius vermicularis]
MMQLSMTHYKDGFTTLEEGRSSERSKPEIIETKATHFFNIKRLANLIVHTDLLDTSATYEKFFIGINGEISIVDETTSTTPYPRPNTLKFVTPSGGRPLELLISEYTLNTLLLKAHNIDAVVFRIGSSSPSFGKLLRTTCSVDEVCLSDIVSEPGEKYPNSQLEIILRSTQPPTVQLSRGIATLRLEGRALFYIEGTTKKIGVIPFETTAIFKVTTANGRVVGNFIIPSLVFKKELDFFGLSSESLDGLRTATKGALTKLINSKLSDGINLKTQPNSRIINPALFIMNDAVLIQADVNVENEFYKFSETNFVRYSAAAKA